MQGAPALRGATWDCPRCSGVPPPPSLRMASGARAGWRLAYHRGFVRPHPLACHARLRHALDHPAGGVRLWRLPRAAAGGGRACDRWRRCPGADAHRRRQEPVLPGAGDRPPARRARRDGGGEPADRADARPGRRAGGSRRACGLPQFDSQSRRSPACRARNDERPPHAAVCGARAGHHAAFPGPARFDAPARPARPVRDRRGALREPVGPRLPQRVPGLERAARTLCRRTAHRAHRHRRRAHARRHHRAAAARRGARLHQQLRPAQHPLCHRREGQRARPAAALAARRARGRCRHRLLPVAQEGRGDRRDGWRPRASPRCPTTPASTRQCASATRTASCARRAW